VKYSRFHRAGKEQKKGFSGGTPPPSLPRSAGEGSLQASPGVVESAFGLLNVMRMGHALSCPYVDEVESPLSETYPPFCASNERACVHNKRAGAHEAQRERG
jgi:hypothetical protein